MVNEINFFSSLLQIIALHNITESRPMKENPDYGIRKIFTWPSPESSNICCWIRNPWFWKSGTHSKESWILLPVIQKPSSTGTESGNPESTPQNPESKTRTPFHGFPHSRTCGKVVAYEYRTIRVSFEKRSQDIGFKQRFFTCSFYMWGFTLSLIKVLYTLGSLVLIVNIEIYGGPKVSWQFQFAQGNFNSTHGNFNLHKAISICSRQFQFYSRQFQFSDGNFAILLRRQF